MIKAGIKPEEYREIKKYWLERLLNKVHLPNNRGYWSAASDILKGDYEANGWKGFTGGAPVFQKFDAVEFINGYSPTSPRMLVKFNGISIGNGNPEWGAEYGVKYLKILLGEPVAVEQKGQNNG